MNAVGTCVIVDGTNVAHRAHHALEATQRRDREGRPLWVVHGVLSMLVTYVRAAGASSLVVAFDGPEGCPSRRALAPSYKMGRATKSPELVEQLPRVLDVLRRAGVVAVDVAEWEADDILASGARLVGASGSSAVLVTSDKDAHQLLDDTTRIYKPEGRWLDDAALFAHYGVASRRWVEYAALVGESADNLPGVNGVGPKRAARLLAAFSDVEDALTQPEEVRRLLGDNVARDLTAGADSFRRNRAVGTLRRDLELDLRGARLDRWDADRLVTVLRDEGLHDAAARWRALLDGVAGRR